MRNQSIAVNGLGDGIFDPQTYIDKFNDFVTKCQQLQAALQNHLTYENAAANDISLYQEWMTIRDDIMNTISGTTDIMAKIDAAKAWFKDNFGLSGTSGLGSLGIFPALVPVGIITVLGIIAWKSADIVRCITEAYTFSQKMAGINSLVAQGTNPADAAAIISKTSESSVIPSMTTYIKYGALILGGYMIYRMVRGKSA